MPGGRRLTFVLMILSLIAWQTRAHARLQFATFTVLRQEIPHSAGLCAWAPSPDKRHGDQPSDDDEDETDQQGGRSASGGGGV